MQYHAAVFGCRIDSSICKLVGTRLFRVLKKQICQYKATVHTCLIKRNMECSKLKQKLVIQISHTTFGIFAMNSPRSEVIFAVTMSVLRDTTNLHSPLMLRSGLLIKILGNDDPSFLLDKTPALTGASRQIACLIRSRLVRSRGSLVELKGHFLPSSSAAEYPVHS